MMLTNNIYQFPKRLNNKNSPVENKERSKLGKKHIKSCKVVTINKEIHDILITRYGKCGNWLTQTFSGVFDASSRKLNFSQVWKSWQLSHANIFRRI